MARKESNKLIFVISLTNNGGARREIKANRCMKRKIRIIMRYIKAYSCKAGCEKEENKIKGNRRDIINKCYKIYLLYFIIIISCTLRALVTMKYHSVEFVLAC